MKSNWGIARACLTVASALPFAFATTALNAAPTIIGSSYQEQISKTCPGTPITCELVYTQVPSAKTLFINTVSCRLQMPSTAKIEDVELRRRVNGSTVGSRQHVAPIQAVSTFGGKTNYLINTHVMLAMDALDRPSILISFPQTPAVDGTWTADCTIHGSLF
jgi:hypothetical protein